MSADVPVIHEPLPPRDPTPLELQHQIGAVRTIAVTRAQELSQSVDRMTEAVNALESRATARLDAIEQAVRIFSAGLARLERKIVPLAYAASFTGLGIGLSLGAFIAIALVRP